MFRIQRVLFPVDFSSGCRALVPTVRRMIESWKSEVILLHVVERRQDLQLERLFARRRAIAGDNIPAERIGCRVEHGAAGECIAHYARSNDIHLVVMPAGGSMSLYGRALGTAADQVLAKAACPVWLDWGSVRSRATAGMYARRVACVLNLDDSDEFVAGEAAAVSQTLDAQLTLIHAVPPARGRVPVCLADVRTSTRELAYARWRLERLRSRFSPEAKVEVSCGPNHAVVSRVLQSQQPGLLVTGNCRETILAAEAECPVLRLVTPTAAAGAGLALSASDALRKSA